MSELETSVEAPSGSTEAPTTEADTSVTPDVNKSLAEANKRAFEERDEARGERDALAEKVARFQRAEIERIASESLAVPADLLALSGNEIGDYLTEDGSVDPDKVAADVAAILAERPGLGKPRPILGFDPSMGLGGKPSKGEPTFADLLKSAAGNNGPMVLHFG